MIWVVFFVLPVIALQKLWNWFVTPLGVMKLSFWHSAGLLVLVSMLFNLGFFISSTVGMNVSVSHVFNNYRSKLLVPLAALVFGHIAKGNIKKYVGHAGASCHGGLGSARRMTRTRPTLPPARHIPMVRLRTRPSTFGR